MDAESSPYRSNVSEVRAGFYYPSVDLARFCGDACLDCLIQAGRVVKGKMGSARSLTSLGL